MNQPLLLVCTDHESCGIALPLLTTTVNFPRARFVRVRVPVRAVDYKLSTGATSETCISFATQAFELQSVCAKAEVIVVASFQHGTFSIATLDVSPIKNDIELDISIRLFDSDLSRLFTISWKLASWSSGDTPLLRVNTTAIIYKWRLYRYYTVSSTNIGTIRYGRFVFPLVGDEYHTRPRRYRCCFRIWYHSHLHCARILYTACIFN
jgi:hypothetical protein